MIDITPPSGGRMVWNTIYYDHTTGKISGLPEEVDLDHLETIISSIKRAFKEKTGSAETELGVQTAYWIKDAE